jgi:hypothetical protein
MIELIDITKQIDLLTELKPDIEGGMLIDNGANFDKIWDILVNGKFHGQLIAFDYVTVERCLGLCVAGTTGYIPIADFSGIYHKENRAFVSRLNTEGLNLQPIDAARICVSCLGVES